jgi:hypothetical protein
MSLLLGLDFGTGGVRVGVFDLATRAVIGSAEAPYRTEHPHPGWAEQSPTDWWDALGAACRGLMRDLGTPRIAAACLATTASTVVVCRRDGTPLCPALLWMDCRAADESARTGQVRHPVLAYSGGADASEWLVPKAMWLATHAPAVYVAADVICECVDYVNFRLSGRWVGSRMNATCKWNYDPLAHGFYGDLFAAFGVPDLETKLPPEILAVGAPIGRLTAAAAEHLGLAGRPLLAQGGIDAHIGMLGANTVDPGNLLMIGGTSVVHLFQLAAQREVPGFWGPYPHALMDGRWLVEGGQVSAGSVLNWLSGTIFQLDADGTRRLLEEAAAFPVDGTGLLTLDYFMGNRTPYRDPHLRGAVIGLSLGHGRAALYRSAVEAVALASANVVQQIAKVGERCERIVTAGGYCRNPLWLRATVDAIGMPAWLTAEENLTIVGAAAAAATGAGLFADLFAAAAAVAKPGPCIEPDPAAHAEYAAILDRYREVTGLLGPVMHGLSAGR